MHMHIHDFKIFYFVSFRPLPVAIQPMAYTQMVTPMIDKAVAPLYMLVSFSVRFSRAGVAISFWNMVE